MPKHSTLNTARLCFNCIAVFDVIHVIITKVYSQCTMDGMLFIERIFPNLYCWWFRNNSLHCEISDQRVFLNYIIRCLNDFMPTNYVAAASHTHSLHQNKYLSLWRELLHECFYSYSIFSIISFYANIELWDFKLKSMFLNYASLSYVFFPSYFKRMREWTSSCLLHNNIIRRLLDILDTVVQRCHCVFVLYTVGSFCPAGVSLCRGDTVVILAG